MIVVDASAMTELLLQTPLGSHVEARLFRDGDEFHAPHLLDVEVVQALRRLVRAGEVLPDRVFLRDVLLLCVDEAPNLVAPDAAALEIAEWGGLGLGKRATL